MQGVRRLFLGGNWKSNNLLADSKKLAELYNKHNSDKIGKLTITQDVVAFPVDAHLSTVRSILRNEIQLGSQDVSYNKFGAFTGETTAEHLLDIGAHWALIGHSERRTLFGDSTPVTFKKLKRAMEARLGVVFCIGETLVEREGGITNQVLSEQLDGLKENTSDWSQLVLAYEPVWAIGTGKVATPEQAEETHKFIRSYIESRVSTQVAATLRIIYGGSVKGDNAASLITKPNIDGFLVGGASLTQDFLKIASVLADHAGK